MKKSWDLIKNVINKNKCIKQKNIKLMVNGNLIEDKSLIANSFNEFFTNIGSNLDKQIPKSNINPISFIKKNFTMSIFLNPTNPGEIEKIITKLRDCAVGWDNFPAEILKEKKTIMSSLLSYMINLSITADVFPQELNIGNIIPLIKAGDSENIGNYRPVSLLSTFSKVYEKVFYIRLLQFFLKQNILYLTQFGFREKHSIYMAILTLLDKITRLILGFTIQTCSLDLLK